MSSVPASQLTPAERDELLCSYAAMVLYDDGLDVNATNMNNLIKASGNTVESYWPPLFSKMVNSVGLEGLITRSSSGGGGGPAVAAGGAAGGAAAGGDATEAKKEEKKVVE